MTLQEVEQAPTALYAPLVRSVSVVASGLRGCPGGMHAMTADSFDVVSQNPALAAVAVGRQARMLRVLEANGVFAVSVLSSSQRWLATWFASRRRGEGSAQFDAVSWRPAAVVRAPLIDDGLAWFECSVHRLVRTGDHVLVVGRILRQNLADSASDPLFRFGGSYRDLAG
jgi:flavin reductase